MFLIASFHIKLQLLLSVDHLFQYYNPESDQKNYSASHKKCSLSDKKKSCQQTAVYITLQISGKKKVEKGESIQSKVHIAYQHLKHAHFERFIGAKSKP